VKYVILASTVLLSGCFGTFAPARHPEFPAAPPILLETCPQLSKTDPNNATLRDMLNTVVGNYSLYYQCAAKTHGWQQWYDEQQQLYKNKP
jgi:hypothetical protein